VLAAYVTGHGYGHLVRLCEVLSAVRARAPDLPITVVGEVPEWLVRRELEGPVALRRVACDAGVAQRDALEIDETATEARCLAFDAAWDERLAAEVAWLRGSGARAVLADVPPLPLAAAARAGLPALGLGNFTWDWIWRHLARRRPGLLGPAARAAAAYGEADLLLELPFAGDNSAFRRRPPVGFVARRPRVARQEARRRLGLDGRPVALLSFGGVGLPALSRAVLPAEPELEWILPEDMTEARLAALGLRYQDVVGAADVVVTKPGYGIVTDAMAAGAALVYTERGDFPEYDVMVRELPGLLACVHLPSAELRQGRIAGAVRRALSLPRPPPPDLGGAARAAERVLSALG
jgi:L-arabinokinase